MPVKNDVSYLRSFPIQYEYHILKFEKHLEIKDTLLKMLEEQNGSNVNIGTDRITKTDYYVDVGKSREYWNFLFSYLDKTLEPIFTPLLPYYNYENFKIFYKNYWMQQYYKKDTHDWHNHNCSWSAVYYVELSKDSPRTQLIEPYSSNIITPNVNEGDILIMPGNVEHCSPPNQSDNRKTIISFNFIIEKDV